MAFHGLQNAYTRKIPIGGGLVLSDSFLYLRTGAMGEIKTKARRDTGSLNTQDLSILIILED